MKLYNNVILTLQSHLWNEYFLLLCCWFFSLSLSRSLHLCIVFMVLFSHSHLVVFIWCFLSFFLSFFYHISIPWWINFFVTECAATHTRWFIWFTIRFFDVFPPETPNSIHFDVLVSFLCDYIKFFFPVSNGAVDSFFLFLLSSFDLFLFRLCIFLCSGDVHELTNSKACERKKTHRHCFQLIWIG